MATSVTLKPNAIDISGSTSGTTTLQASAVAGTTTLTLPAATDTLVGKATTDTLTNKTLTGAAMNGTLGATTPSTASVTTLTTSSTVTHSGGTANGVAYLDGSKVLTTGSALVFDGSNLGLGVTPSAWGSRKALEVGNAGSALFSVGANQNYLTSNSYFDGAFKYGATGTATAYQQYAGTHAWLNAVSGSAGGVITFTQAMTLDASGNLGVGITSPTQRFQVEQTQNGSTWAYITNGNSGTGAAAGVLFGTDQGAAGALSQNSSNAGYGTAANALRLRNLLNAPLTFETNGSERCRITSGGDLLVGATSSPYNVSKGGSLTAGGGLGLADNGGNDVAFICKNGSTAGTLIKFYYNASSSGSASGGSSPGSITTNGTTTAYNTSSDYRLKNTIAPMTGALAKVAQLKPVTYKWNADGSDGEGFIAHELAEVVPQCVTGEKDAVDVDGKPVYQGIDTSFLVATLTAAIKEQQAIIQSLTDRITALESA